MMSHDPGLGQEGGLRHCGRLSVAGLVVFCAAATMLALSWSKDWHSVHQVTGPGPMTLAMQRGAYAIYEDPGGSAGFPLPLGDISVTGPDGPVVLIAQSTQVSPSDIGALFLGTGMFAPVASFRTANAGSYHFYVRGQLQDEKVLIGRTEWSALGEVEPWLACLAGGLALAVGGWLARRRDARP